MTITALKSEEISKQLELLNESLEVNWNLESGKLTKTFVFKNFICGVK